MKIQTQYSYEKIWTDTTDKDLLRMIEEEIGDADPEGTLTYVKEMAKNEKVIGIGSCKFREKINSKIVGKTDAN
ncbi:hypothetical protein JHD49_08350 [Sulfurimonas sp. SAG-AH-194-C21]|nr:hypothetical protein [Sulfurimonas sp. SAG-AH-194-C21]MDF1883945.1 hypothetical protein [Sulfurimonas sp. SAG-AH-194-C21]